MPESDETNIFGTSNGDDYVPPVEDKGDGTPPPDGEVKTEVKTEEVKEAEKADNLKEQGKIIAKQQQEIAELKAKEPIDVKELPYDPSSIKHSKDLTEDEREEMTSSEIKAMDATADAQLKANEIAEGTIRSKRQEELKGSVDNEHAVLNADDSRKAVADEVTRLAEGNAEREREINDALEIIDFKGLTKAETVERIGKATKLIPNFTPPKENVSMAGGGGAVTQGGSGDDSKIDGIIKDVSSSREAGGYSL